MNIFDTPTLQTRYIMGHANGESDTTPNPEPDPEVVDYAAKHGKKEAYLYNNRIFSMFINPSNQRCAEYNANWNYINSLPE